MMYYNYYQKNNCQLRFVRTYNNDRTEIWCIRDTDMNEIIGFLHYHIENNNHTIFFEKYGDIYTSLDYEMENLQDVIKDFENNVEYRMYEGV